jgi:hypothetical protein
VTELAAPSVIGPNARAAADAEAAPGAPARKRPRHPDDFESENDFLEHVRKTFDADTEADQQNRAEMVEDARFVAGEQWDAAVRQRRAAANKPTLTINRLPAYVAQLVGNRRLNDTGIRVQPDAGGEKKIAEIREGLIRSIQKISRAQHAYDTAFQQAVIGGLGNFQVHLDYAHDDVFEQDIRIVAIPNPLSVVWDRASVDPTGADAEHVFVVDTLPRDEFKRRYPKAQAGEWNAELSSSRHGYGDTAEGVQILSFWRMRSRQRTVALLRDGSIQDVTDIDIDAWFDAVATGSDGEPLVREVQRKYAQLYICTNHDILAGPYDLPVQRVPVFRVPGWELMIEGDRIRWGMVRFLRDPQRLHNYWRSTIAEKLVGSPKAKWKAADTSVEGHEQPWRESHLSDDPLLIWNAASGQPPERVEPIPMEAALIQEAGLASQDIRDVSNIHEASLGMESNEVSGRAIMARQRVGEVGTVIYDDNLNAAIEECGKTINHLIPFVYDTPRTIKVLGKDMRTEQLVRVNDDGDPGSVDITLGKYSVTVATGPSYTTRRVEAREEMMAMVNAMPQTMSIAADKIVEAQDWPGAEEIARRLRSQLPPGMVSEQDMDEAQIAQQQQAAQAQQQQAALQQQMLQLEIADKQADLELKRISVAEKQAKIVEAQARAHQAVAQAEKTLSEVGVAREKVEVERERRGLEHAKILLAASQH